MKIAVTGATGHVGITLCKALIADHYDVVGFYRNEAKAEPLKTLNMQLCQGDVLDASFLEQHLADVDVVINLAAMISIDGDPNGTVMKTNIEGPRNIVNCCEKLGIKQLIHFSSIHSLKYNADDDVVNEETPFYSGNKFSYKLSKAKGEQEAHKAVDKGIHLTVFRPTSIIGPNDYAPSEVGEILLNLYHGKMPSLLKTGFDWVDVRDIVTATIAALNIGSRPSGEVYMLSGHWHSLKELSLMGSAATGKKMVTTTLPTWVAFASLPFIPLIKKFMDIPSQFTYEALSYLVETNKNISHRKAAETFNYKARPTAESIVDIYDFFAQQDLL